ncbi:hypothetical protein HZS_4640 [Henneguya salminicola]|nr:hypothetical protein HZS_4640 [Henneguya salminicola]
MLPYIRSSTEIAKCPLNKKIFNIIFNVQKLTINIKWNNFSKTDPVSSNNFISDVFISLYRISGDYSFLTFEHDFHVTFDPSIISHQVNNWIHTLFRSDTAMSFDYKTIFLPSINSNIFNQNISDNSKIICLQTK